MATNSLWEKQAPARVAKHEPAEAAAAKKPAKKAAKKK